MDDGAAPYRHDIAGLRAALPGMAFEAAPALVRQRSRDFFWFSPILNRVLRDKAAEVIARPRDESEVVALGSVCAGLRIPVTVRGAGTGTYGQGVPERGGVLLDMTALDRVVFADPSRGARAGAGARVMAVEEAAIAAGGEPRMHPSTKRMATIGGCFCGGPATRSPGRTWARSSATFWRTRRPSACRPCWARTWRRPARTCC